MDRLPVEHDPARILADEIVADFERAGGARLGIVLQHFAPAGDAGVGRDLDEHPGVLQDERLDLGDLDVIFGSDLRGVRSLGAPSSAKAERCRPPNSPRNQVRRSICVLDIRCLLGRRQQGVPTTVRENIRRQYTRVGTAATIGFSAVR